MNFYDPGAAFGYGTAYGLATALTEGAADPTCAKQPDGTQCAHAQLECWSGQKPILTRGVEAKELEFGGANGMVGQMKWYISHWAVEKEPSLATYFGLQDKAKTAKYLKKPIAWGEYCEKYSPNNCTASCATCHASSLPKEGDKKKYFTSADPTSGYMGYFHFDGVGHIVVPPCTWSVLPDAKLHYNGLAHSLIRDGTIDAAGGYGYGDILQIMEAGARNHEATLSWWWAPDAALNRYAQKQDKDAEWFRLQPVTLKTSTSECVRNRPWDGRCDVNATKRIGAKDGGCDFDAEGLFKAFATSLEKYNPPQHAFLKALQITSEDSMDMLAKWRWSGLPDTWSVAPRVAVCNFVADNLDGGLKLRQFVPAGYPKRITVHTISSSITTALLIFGIAGVIIDVVLMGWLIKNLTAHWSGDRSLFS